jgi:hypothetical protein
MPDSNKQKNNSWWQFFKRNVIHEWPFGHILTEGLTEISHDLKHAGGMVSGTVLMIVGPMPMPDDMDSEAAMKILLFGYMLSYMYLGDIAFKVTYNIATTGVKSLWHCIYPPNENSEESELLSQVSSTPLSAV